MKDLEKYLTGEYLFHGSPNLLSLVEPAQSSCDTNSKSNIDNAIFLTPLVEVASAYAFKDTIAQASEGLEWEFNVNQSGKLPIMIMRNIIITDNINGYIYVFKKTDEFVNDPVGSLQYKSYNPLIPVDVIKVNYEDFKRYYQQEELSKSR